MDVALGGLGAGQVHCFPGLARFTRPPSGHLSCWAEHREEEEETVRRRSQRGKIRKSGREGMIYRGRFGEDEESKGYGNGGDGALERECMERERERGQEVEH